MTESREQFLPSLCDAIYRAEALAEEERRKEAFGESVFTELLLLRQDKVRVEIRKENVNHNAPHLHITHSDKINVSLALADFRILAGEIDRKSLKHFLRILMPVQPKLLHIWKTLNEKDDSTGAEKLISNLFS